VGVSSSAFAVVGHAQDEFGAALDLQLSASQPIRSVEHLRGRDRELDGIRKSLYAAGRHVFIYGDRGVGKSSLGQTAAVQYQGSGDSPVFVSGSPDDTFNTVIANVIVQALHRSRTQTKKSTISAGFQFAGLTLGGDVETSRLLVERGSSGGNSAKPSSKSRPGLDTCIAPLRR
jgi:hypothetical protein